MVERPAVNRMVASSSLVTLANWPLVLRLAANLFSELGKNPSAMRFSRCPFCQRRECIPHAAARQVDFRLYNQSPTAWNTPVYYLGTSKISEPRVSLLPQSNTSHTYETSTFLMTDGGKLDPEPKHKAVGWRISEPLRHRLTSHAEYLSVDKETSTEAMVAEWLEERLQIEERKRALRTLAIEEKDLPKRK
jgi:hypothetical protein